MFHCSFTVINILENTWVTCQCQYLRGCRVGHREGGVGVGQAKNIKDKVNEALASRLCIAFIQCQTLSVT